MLWKQGLSQLGVMAALGAALLFGSSTPLAKWLLVGVDPWLLAGLFYLGSGLVLMGYHLTRQRPPVRLAADEKRWLAGAVLVGGVTAPVLLLFGLTALSAASASLLLNAEGVFTALLAWFVFGENFDRRIALGMIAIIAGAAVLSWPQQAQFIRVWPTLAVLGACFAWALDNNLTRKVSLIDATWIAAIKGLAAGSANLLLALTLGAAWPSFAIIIAALVIGALAYGVSLALFVIGLRHLGTARTSAYFSVAPFFGAILAIVFLGEPITLALLAAGILMALGVWLHLTEQHTHPHTHEPIAHDHEHQHDAHHQHSHDAPLSTGVSHRHWHQHEPLAHSHAHFPDTHHRHDHE
jgi:drug/metabolite transporter (DMT)-like permease